MSTDLQQEFDRELSELLQQYAGNGLDGESMADSLLWHSELALSRTTTEPERENVLAD